MECKTVFDGNTLTVNFGKTDAEQLEEGFLTSTLWSALTVNVELTDLTPEMSLAKSVLMLSASKHFDFEKFCKAMDYLTGDDEHEKAN